MHKKIFTLLLTLFLFAFSFDLVVAQEEQSNLQQRITIRKEQLEEHREEAKAQFTEKVRNRVQTTAQNMIKRLERRIERLGNFTVRLEELADDFEAKGADVTDTRVQISQASAYLDTASADLETVEDSLDQLLDSQYPHSDFDDLRTNSSKVRDDLYSARKALAEAVSLLKVQEGGLDE